MKWEIKVIIPFKEEENGDNVTAEGGEVGNDTPLFSIQKNIGKSLFILEI